jgi:hypothetical protein
MMAIRIASLAAAIVLAAPVDTLAQQATFVAPGARVRVSAPSVAGQRLVGTVARLDADTIVVRSDGWGNDLAVPLGSVTALDVGRGRQSRALRFGGIGAAIGAVIGTFLMIVDEGTSAPNVQITDEEPPLEWVARPVWQKVRYPLLSAAAGFGIGAIIGVAFPGERWEAVPLEGLRLRVTPQPASGINLTASFTL